MGLRHEQYAKDLVTTHGIEKAVDIVKDAIHTTKRESGHLTLFGEADMYINDRGQYQLSKIQTDKPLARKNKRIKDTLNFYNEVLKLLTRKPKHGNA